MTRMTSKGTPVPRMLRGSLVTLRRRCGKPSCHCADGDQRHEAPALSYSDHGRTRVVMLAEADLAAVTAALERRPSRQGRVGVPGQQRTGRVGRTGRGRPRRPAPGPVTGFLAALGLARGVFTAPSFAIFTDLLTGWEIPARRGGAPSPR